MAILQPFSLLARTISDYRLASDGLRRFLNAVGYVAKNRQQAGTESHAVAMECGVGWDLNWKWNECNW